MIIETYKGCKIRAVKGKGWDWGRTRITLNGVDQGTYEGDEAKVIARVKGSIDHAEQTGPAEARYGAEWYPPGTYALCPEGHVTAIGGECSHHWCVKQRTTRPTPPAQTEPDLGEQVTAYLLDNDIESGRWSSFRHALDGTVAVTLDTVPIGGRKVQIQILGQLAATLRRAGFELTVETVWPEQTEPVDGGALYLHITGRAATAAHESERALNR